MRNRLGRAIGGVRPPGEGQPSGRPGRVSPTEGFRTQATVEEHPPTWRPIQHGITWRRWCYVRVVGARRGRVREAGLVAGECETVDAPYVADAPAVLECGLFKLVDLDAPNTLVIGEVRGVLLDPTLEVDASSLNVSVESPRPVGRLGLDEYTLLGEVRRIARPRIS